MEWSQFAISLLCPNVASVLLEDQFFRLLCPRMIFSLRKTFSDISHFHSHEENIQEIFV